VNSEESVQAPNQAQDKEAIRYVWGDLIDELGLDSKRANELMRIYLDTKETDREAKLHEELGEAGYQAYLDYLPTLPLRSEIVSLKAELANRNITLDRETEKTLIQIIREEQTSVQSGEVPDSRSDERIRERIYQRVSGVFSGESLSLFKAWGQGKL
jgi:hypothetical protein